MKGLTLRSLYDGISGDSIENEELLAKDYWESIIEMYSNNYFTTEKLIEG